ncbi:MAG: glycosyltransferase family 4 protein [Rikenellaceae bacterium]
MLKKNIKIGCIGLYDPKNIRTQSGVAFMMCKAFENMGAEVVWIQTVPTLRYKMTNIFCKIILKLFKINLICNKYITSSKELAKNIDKTKFHDIDIFLCINSPESVAYLDLPKPLIYRSDSTFNLMIDYYIFNVSKKTKREGNIIEQKVLNKASIVLYPSLWAKKSALIDYKQEEEKLHVIESGANIEEIKISNNKYKKNGVLNLLFLGVDWKRKGGDIALEACRYLYEKNIDVKINIVGIKKISSKVNDLPYVNYIGFLDKNNQEEYDKLLTLIESSHILLLPTIAECAGIVFCECSAFGLPSFTYDTGGVGNYVINGINGYRLPLGSRGEDFGEKIYQCIQTDEINILSKQAVDLYNEKLNWKVWQEKVEDIVNNII